MFANQRMLVPVYIVISPGNRKLRGSMVKVERSTYSGCWLAMRTRNPILVTGAPAWGARLEKVTNSS